MISRSSSGKKIDMAVKFSLPEESRVLNALTAETVHPKNGLALEHDSNEKEDELAKICPSILVAVDRHKEDPLKIYWDSKEAKNLFRPIGDETVQQAIETQIQLLVGAFNGSNWKYIVDPETDVDKEFIHVPDVKEKAMALSVALDLAKRDKPAKTWAQCCEEAVNLIYVDENIISSTMAPSSAKLQEWYREFRDKRYFLSKKNREKKRDEKANLKKELDEAMKQNAILLAKIEKVLPKVKSSMKAADLLAEIERDMADVKVED